MHADVSGYPILGFTAADFPYAIHSSPLQDSTLQLILLHKCSLTHGTFQLCNGEKVN